MVRRDVHHPRDPLGTVNGSASLSIPMPSSGLFKTVTYPATCTGQTAGGSTVAGAPGIPPGANYTSVDVTLAGGGGGGGGSPAESSSGKVSYGQSGGIAGYIGGTNSGINSTVAINVNGSSGSTTPPTLAYDIGCGGAGGAFSGSGGTGGTGGGGFGTAVPEARV